MSQMAEVSASRPTRPGIRRLLVTTRTEAEGSDSPRPYRAVGLLSCEPTGFRFSYLQGVTESPEFQPIAGLSDVGREYRAETLFPTFANRVMSARRPDRPRFLRAIDLDENSEPWEILSRSGGRRGGDTIEVMEEPIVAEDGSTESVFLVHGTRHKGDSASDRIAQLAEGERLELRLEPTNPVNERAVLVCADDGTELGYVPDPLVEYVQTVRRSPYDLRVLRANGADVAPHLRLLVRLVGSVPAGYTPFT